MHGVQSQLTANADCFAKVGDGEKCTAIKPCLAGLPASCANKTLQLLAPGVFDGPNNTNISIASNESVALIGGMGSDESIIDGGGTDWILSVSGSGSLSLTNVTLQHGFTVDTDPVCQHGSALSIFGQGIVRVTGVRFWGNEAHTRRVWPNLSRGGAVAVIDSGADPTRWLDAVFVRCEWDGNWATGHSDPLRNGAQGGAVCVGNHLIGASPSFFGCLWRNNTTTEQGFGGGLGWSRPSSAPGAPLSVLRSCIFENNHAGYVGGGIYTQHVSLSLVDCIWRNNIASYSGGGGKFSTATIAAFTNCSFENNSAIDQDGGGISMQRANTTFVNCSWLINQAGGQGGGIKIESQVNLPAFVDCKFEGNRAHGASDRNWVGNSHDGGGGGVAVVASPGLKFSGVIFLQNEAVAGPGGGILFRGQASPGQLQIHFEHCQLEANRALSGGGGVFLEISPSTTHTGFLAPPAILTLQSTVFVRNSASLSGGAVEASFPPDVPANLHFIGENCTAFQTAGTCGDPTTASNNPAPPCVNNTARKWARSTVLKLMDVAFDGNIAGTNGGALTITNGVVVMENAIMTANSAGDHGGAVYLGGTASLNAADTTWSNNIADSQGQSTSADGQHAFAAVSAGEWNFSGQTSFEHTTKNAYHTAFTSLSAAKVDGAHGLISGGKESVLTVICPDGSVLAGGQWVTNFTAESMEWRLDGGETTTTVTGWYLQNDTTTGGQPCTDPFNNGTSAGGLEDFYCQLPPKVITRNNTICKDEYFANWLCGNPPPVLPLMLYTTVSLGCRQCDRSEAALPAPTAGVSRASSGVENRKCERCPASWVASGAAACISGHVIQAPGWWRPEADGFVTKDTQFWQCFSHEAACIGSRKDSPIPGAPAFGTQCAEGHTGPVCALCKPGYAMRMHRCGECTGNTSASAAIAAVAFVTISGAGFLVIRWRSRRGIPTAAIITAKIAVGFYSLLALATDTYLIVFPDGFHAILATVRVAFTSIADLSTMACAFPINIYGQLYLWCSCLVVLLGGIAMAYLRAVSAANHRGNGQAATDGADEDGVVGGASTITQISNAALRAKYNGYAFNAALVFYPFISRTAIVIFKCREVDGSLFLEADFTQRCEGTSWYLAIAGSAVICVVYVFGLPAFIAHEAMTGSGAISFYAEGYRTDRGRLALGWEVLEMFRKFLLTSAVIFFHQGSVEQVAIALVLSVMFLVLHVRVLPFADNLDNWLQGVALTALCIVYFSGIIIKALGPEAGAAYDPVLQASSLAVIALLAVVPAFLKAKRWCSGRGKKSQPPLQLESILDSDGGGNGNGNAKNSGLSRALLSSGDNSGCAFMNDNGGRGGDGGGEDGICTWQLRAELATAHERLRQEQNRHRLKEEEFAAAARQAEERHRLKEEAAQEHQEQLRQLRDQLSQQETVNSAGT
jgi:hypothetical protein